MSHTPGPWRFDRAGDERIVAERVCVALVTRGVDAECDEDMRGPTFEANASLIAAAPEMLQALKETIGYWDACGFSDCDDGCDCIVHFVRAAIAKAEGKS